MQSIYALTIVFMYFALGELIALLTKAKIQSPLARTVIILITLWTGIVPKTVFQDAGYLTFANILIGILITGMGNSIDIAEAKRQIKTVIVSFFGMLAGVILILLIGSKIIGSTIAFAGSPIYAGGNSALF